MADIEYRCVKCSAIRVVSEFADAAKLKCPACGESLRKAGEMPPAAGGDAATPPAGLSRLKVARQQPGQTEPESLFGSGPGMAGEKAQPPSREDGGGAPLLDLHPRVKRKSTGPSNTLLAFLLFAALGVITGYLRYAGIMEFPGREYLPQALLDHVLCFAWVGILFLNTIVVIRAMNDNMFQGILCLFIPGWSVIYLLFISDNFYLRAIVFGCMIGLGQDGGHQIYEGVAVAMGHVSEFINSGGGAIRRDPAL